MFSCCMCIVYVHSTGSSSYSIYPSSTTVSLYYSLNFGCEETKQTGRGNGHTTLCVGSLSSSSCSDIYFSLYTHTHKRMGMDGKTDLFRSTRNAIAPAPGFYCHFASRSIKLGESGMERARVCTSQAVSPPVVVSLL